MQRGAPTGEHGRGGGGVGMGRAKWGHVHGTSVGSAWMPAWRWHARRTGRGRACRPGVCARSLPRQPQRQPRCIASVQGIAPCRPPPPAPITPACGCRRHSFQLHAEGECCLCCRSACACSHKVWLQLEEKQIPYTMEKINMRCYGDKPPSFTAKVGGWLGPRAPGQARQLRWRAHAVPSEREPHMSVCMAFIIRSCSAWPCAKLRGVGAEERASGGSAVRVYQPGCAPRSVARASRGCADRLGGGDGDGDGGGGGGGGCRCRPACCRCWSWTGAS